MKKFISLLIALAMVMSLTISTFATEGGSDDDIKIVTNAEYGFQIAETFDNNHRIIRTFERNENTFQAKMCSADGSIGDYSETKALLLALGMKHNFIDRLSDEDLEAYSTAPRICSTVTHTKTDADDNVTYLEESVAIREAAIINKEIEDKKIQLQKGNISLEGYQSSVYEDSFMYLIHLVMDLGDGELIFSESATWLTMPFFRSKDSIGSCAQNGTVINDTRSGWYEYDIENIVGTNTTYDYFYSQISSTDFNNAINGSWYGSAAYLDLPLDSNFGPGIYTLYNNYSAHYQYSGHVNYPTLESWFNSVGSYYHTTYGVTISPTIEIDVKGVSASIGIDFLASIDRRSAEVEVHYIP